MVECLNKNKNIF